MLNEKLARWSAADKDVVGSVANPIGGGARSDALIHVTVRKLEEKRGVARREVTLSLHERALRLAGWVQGDKVLFDYDPATCEMFIYRDRRGKTIGRPKTRGATRSYVRFCLRDAYAQQLMGRIASNVEIHDKRIALVLVPDDEQ